MEDSSASSHDHANNERTHFRSEAEMLKVLLEAGDKHFRFVSEVWMEHADGDNMRIDLIAWPKKGVDFPVDPPLIGFEIKAEHKMWKTFSGALKQAIDYRHGVISDHRMPSALRGVRPAFIFVFPDYEYDLGYSPGARRIAGHYNVGVARIEDNYHGSDALTLYCSDERLWDSARGPKRTLAKWGTGRKRGAK